MASSSIEMLIVNAEDSPDLKAGACLVKVFTVPNSSECIVIARRVNPHLDEACYYRSYLALDTIWGATRTYSDIPEEALFINVHQVNEIGMHREIEVLQRLIGMV
jgi:hypothetical protein